MLTTQPTVVPDPPQDWEETRLHWQLICQILGKIRLTLHPFLNHWWHVPLYVSPRGLTTGPIPYQGGQLDIEMDLIEHRVVVRTSGGDTRDLPLVPMAICDFYERLMGALRDLGVSVSILADPYKCKSTVPFAEDTGHAQYDPEAVHQAWQVLVWSDGVLKEFRSRFVGKCSPVHMFWHSFDLAVTRFSGRPAPEMPGADRVTQEAYSHEVCSAGFWFGDDNVPEPAFYCYTAPAPPGLTDHHLLPHEAYWKDLNGSPTALLPYRHLQGASNASELLMEFLQTSYEAGASAAGWNRDVLER